MTRDGYPVTRHTAARWVVASMDYSDYVVDGVWAVKKTMSQLVEGYDEEDILAVTELIFELFSEY
jgi:hypothetical protein